MTDSDTTSIHELLRHEEEAPADERRSRSAVAWLVKILVYAAALAALAVLALHVAGLTVPYVLAFTVMLALFVLRRLVRLVAAPPPARAAMVRRSAALDDEASYHWGSGDGLRSAVSQWEHRLEWGHDSAGRFARGVQPRLAEFADERLRMRHGINRAGDPARAREVLGEPLWTFLHGPVDKSPTPRELAAVLARMEEL
jgi:hypothetical protein